MDCCNVFKRGKDGGSSSCGVYGLAAIGAAVYYIHNATSFWMGVLGILKALVWPAMVAYRVFEFFGM
jgi:hypothetical protein